MRKTILIALVLAIVAVTAVSCSPHSDPSSKWRCPGCNVILISIDTLRADRLGIYGNSRNVSPNIDRLASEGVLFERALSQASSTMPSHMSIFTSHYPLEHRVCNLLQCVGCHSENGSLREFSLSESIVTLPEVLRAHGYYTLASTGGLSASRGFSRGFYKYNGDGLEGFTDSEDSLSRLLEAADGRPFFLFLHTYKTHEPYFPGELTRSTFCGGYSGPVIDSLEKLYEQTVRALENHPESEFSRAFFEGLASDAINDSEFSGELFAITARGYAEENVLELASLLRRLREEGVVTFEQDKLYGAVRVWDCFGKPLFIYPGKARVLLIFDTSALAERDVDYLRCLYDAEVFEMDESIGRLLSALERNGLSSSTIVILTSDHGEEFYEHGGFGHGKRLYDELLHVPLIMRLPRSAFSSVRISAPTRSIDIFPSVLDMLGISVDLGLRGFLVPLMDNQSVETLPVYAEEFVWDYNAMKGNGSNIVEFINNMVQDSIDGTTYKLIKYSDGRQSLFNLDDDPGEQRDLSSEEPALSDILGRKLSNHTEESARWWSQNGKSDAEGDGEELKNQLRSLGYLG